MEEFVFNDLKQEDLQDYIDKAYVFNMSEEDILKEKIVLTSFSDESIGSAQECLDIAIFLKNEWKLLNIHDKIEGYNEIPLGYLVENTEFDRILIVIRRMSTVILDRNKESSSQFIYSKLNPIYSGITDHPELVGKFAKYQIYLDREYEDVIEDITLRFSERVKDELLQDLSRL